MERVAAVGYPLENFLLFVDLLTEQALIKAVSFSNITHELQARGSKSPIF